MKGFNIKNIKNIKTLLAKISERHRLVVLIVGVLLIIYPLVVPSFFAFQIGAYSLILGTIALALMFLAGYGGMVNLAQLTVAGVAGYLVAILGTSNLGMGLPWWLVIPLAIAGGALAGTLIGFISVRTEGIYMIMITLAISVVFFYLVRQNYAVFNGFTGFAGVSPPKIAGIYLRDPLPFYYLALFVAAFFYFTVLWVSRSGFGIALQAVRDNPRRMNSLGYPVVLHKIVATFYAAVIAATAGVLLVWFKWTHLSRLGAYRRGD